MKCYEALAAALVQEGVDTVFGMIGGEVGHLAQALVDLHQVRFVAVRHEEVAVGMADGFSRATGKIGVALVCLGPGLSNAASPMLGARKANSQLLLICGGSPEVREGRLPGQPMHIDEPPFIRASIGAVQECRAPLTLSEDVALTFRHLRLGRGPIALLFQETVAFLDMPQSWVYESRGVSEVSSRPVGVRGEDVAEIAARWRKAERPVLLGGRGAYRADARGELIALAARSGSLLVTSLQTKNWFQDDPFNLGVSGGFSSAGSSAILAQADLVVAFGASLNNSTLGHGKLYPRAKFLQIDTDPEAINDLNRVERGYIADAKMMAQALLMAMEPIERPGWRDETMITRIRAIDRWEGRDLNEPPGSANPRRVIQACDDLLPKERLLVTDIGLFMGVPAAYITVPTPADVLLPWQYGRVGCAIPIAMGAALGRPDRLVTAFVGDGGMMAAVHALDTIRAHQIPLLIVVMDDGGFGAERRAFRHHDQQTTTADYVTPDLDRIAAAFGLQGFKVSSAAQMRRLLTSHDFRKTATIVQVIMTRDSTPSEMIAAGWA